MRVNTKRSCYWYRRDSRAITRGHATLLSCQKIHSQRPCHCCKAISSLFHKWCGWGSKASVGRGRGHGFSFVEAQTAFHTWARLPKLPWTLNFYLVVWLTWWAGKTKEGRVPLADFRLLGIKYCRNHLVTKVEPEWSRIANSPALGLKSGSARGTGKVSRNSFVFYFSCH